MFDDMKEERFSECKSLFFIVISKITTRDELNSPLN